MPSLPGRRASILVVLGASAAFLGGPACNTSVPLAVDDSDLGVRPPRDAGIAFPPEDLSEPFEDIWWDRPGPSPCGDDRDDCEVAEYGPPNGQFPLQSDLPKDLLERDSGVN